MTVKDVIFEILRKQIIESRKIIVTRSLLPFLREAMQEKEL